MNIILGHDMVVQDMEGSCWEALTIILFLQEKNIEMELCFIYSPSEVLLVFKCQSFLIPPLTILVKIRPKTDG